MLHRQCRMEKRKDVFLKTVMARAMRLQNCQPAHHHDTRRRFVSDAASFLWRAGQRGEFKCPPPAKPNRYQAKDAERGINQPAPERNAANCTEKESVRDNERAGDDAKGKEP